MTECPNCGHHFEASHSAPVVGLTKRQRDLLVFIRTYQALHGFAPCFDEMKDALNLKSKSGIQRLVVGLTERGALKHPQRLARGVTITDSGNASIVSSIGGTQ